ncbi:MAG TPA: hypothetical protein VNJ08_11285 [Bacteriovoracaceae bacterium]|nr:hypothetical protein [Bacteriovoracaceae bacterium]
MKIDMKFRPFLTSKRKSYELLVLVGLNVGLYFVWSSFHILMLFNLGFIWNWAASQPVDYVFESNRYRFSLMKVVYNLHTIFMMPFKSLHPAFSILPRALPAGLFWWLVIHFADSSLAWWPTFIGSLVYELTQLDALLIKPAAYQDLPPAIPVVVTEAIIEVPEDKIP